MPRGNLVVCVPARNEAERLPRLIQALARQTLQGIAVLVALNNTTDQSLGVIRSACLRHPALKVIVNEATFAAADAHAGSARRRAMDCAADIAGPAGFILTTDADTRPPPKWLAANAAAMAHGLDIVGGRIVMDEDEPMDDAVAAARVLADRYWARVRELEDAIDPVPWDPPPRHGDHTGASLCVSVSAYRRCGGVPTIRTGEDRALVQAVIRQGGKLAHPAGIWTRVSPRAEGRADGGMADYIKHMQERCRANAEIMLPSFAQFRARAAWRRDTRAQGGAALVAELEDRLPPLVDDMALTRAALESAE
jgi:hypothetical protein